MKRWSFALTALSLVILLTAEIVASDPALSARWSVDEYDAGPISFEALAGRLVTLTITGADAAPQVEFACVNAATSESGAVRLWPVSARQAGSDYEMLFNLRPLWGALPYPIDPAVLESKPMAIISQQLEESPYRVNPARLRSAFADVVAYMATTAGHHYGLPLGDGRLDCHFDVNAGDQVAHSDVLAVIFGRGLPTSVYPRDFARPMLYGWPLWVLTEATLPEVPAPPDEVTTRRELEELLSLQRNRTPEQINLIRQWDDGTAIGPWITVTLDAIITHNSNPPRAARALALVSVALYEATVAGSQASWQAQRPAPCQLEPALVSLGGGCDAFSYPSEHAAAAGAAAAVLAHLYPGEAERFAALAHESVLARLWAGANYRSDIEAGLELGRQVGQAVISRAISDGADAAWDGEIPAFNTWLPTPPDYYDYPTEPLAGTWRPWNLESGSALRPPPPPAPDTDWFLAEAREVYAIGRELTLTQQQIASYWEDKKGTYTPPGHWNAIALRMVCMDGLSTAEAALLFAALNTAQADAFIAAWDAKYAYWSVRPVTAIRALIDSDWWPYIITPPFPSYVSGHATVSGAASTVLAHFFPTRASEITQWAEEAALSRLYGGIHFRIDNEIGFEMGREAAARALDKIAPASWGARS